MNTSTNRSRTRLHAHTTSLPSSFLTRYGVGLLLVSLAGCTPAAHQGVVAESPEAQTSPSDPSTAFSEDALYETAPPEQREQPPAAGPAPDWAFPSIVDSTLPNGLAVNLVTRSSLPLVDIRLLVRSGQASDGEKPGTAVLAGEMLKAGGTGRWSSRELLERVEALGSSLEIITGRDTTSISMSVTSNQFEEALGLLASVVLQPRFDVAEFNKLKRREMDRVESAGRSDAGWAANMVLFQELYSAQTPHPYSDFDATAKEIEKRSLWEAKRWYQQHFVPKNAALIVAGDIDQATLSKAASTHLGKWRGGAPPRLEFPELAPREGLQVYLVDRPKSPQAEVVLATLGPERDADDYAALKVANQVLGGGVSGRLFLDVREKRSLAYSTYSSVEEVAHGPMPLLLRAGTQTAKAGLALQALLEHSQMIAQQPAAQAEVETATLYLSDVFLLRTETVGALTYMTGSLWLHGLPDDYYDRYRDRVRATDASAMRSAASRYYGGETRLAVVAGDAERLAEPLSHFGEVVVIDPDKGFERRTVIPHNPEAPVELPRVDGT